MEHLEKIKEIVSETLEIDPEDMTETSLFKEDHGANSLLAIEILGNLEKEFDIIIPQNELAKMVNMQKVNEVVKIYLEGSLNGTAN